MIGSMVLYVFVLRSAIPVQDLLVCQEAAEPVLKAIDQLLLSVKTIEGAVDKLELDSREMMLAMGLDKQPKPRLTF